MIFGLLDTLRQELDRNPTGIFLHVRTAEKPRLVCVIKCMVTSEIRE